MNTERLLQLADMLLRADEAHGIQRSLENVRNAFDNLASQPQHEGHQRDARAALTQLGDNVRAFEEGLTPAQIEAIRSLGAEPYFLSAMPSGLEALMASNGITPSVVRDRIIELQTARQDFLRRLQETRTGLTQLGVAGAPGETGVEIGFLLPRAMFKNTLDGLAKEYLQLNRILQVFSEVATGGKEPVELRELSTTDPFTVVGLATPTAIAFAQAVNWLLKKTREIIELKKLYEEAKKVGMPEAVTEPIKTHINDSIQAGIAQQSKEIIAEYPHEDEGRANELVNALTIAIRQMFEKVERGMTVELRFLPPPPQSTETDEAKQKRAEQFAKLGELAKEMDFPTLTGEPLLALEAPEEDQDDG